MTEDIDRMAKQLAPARAAIIGHPVWSALAGLPQVRAFMEHHVFAVLDFMALLKTLQRDLTCTRTAWHPVGDPATRRLVNEIVLAEESDDLGDGRFASHFELYLDGMQEAGADTRAARRLATMLAEGHVPTVALAGCDGPPAAVRFSRSTWRMTEMPLHCRAAVFAFTREDLIPDMFAQAVDRVGGPELGTFRDYLARHIALDGEQHGPAAMRMVAACCGPFPARWETAAQAAAVALQARRELWDAVAAQLAP